MATKHFTNDSTNQQTYRQTIVADALRAAADATQAGDDTSLVTMLSVALFNLPAPLKPALFVPLASDSPAGGWERWERL